MRFGSNFAPGRVASVSWALAVLFIVGCSGGDAGAPVQVPTTPPVQALTSVAKYTLVIRNASTGALVTDPVAVTLSGAGTVNMSGAAATSFTTSNGLQAFASAPGVAAGGQIRVSTQSRAAGWTDGTAVVTVNASDTVQNVELRLTNITRAAEIPTAVPVAAAAASVAVVNGAAVGTVTLTTVPKAVSAVGGGITTLPSASVVIPAATRITNAAGQSPIGALQLTVIARSLDTAEGAKAIPGTTAADGSRLRLGGLMTNLLTDSTGVRFTSFSNAVTARMPIARNVRNAENTRLLAAGDTAPIYTWNAATSQFVFRTNGTVVSTPSGLVAEYPKLSFSDDAMGFPMRDSGTCTAVINFTGRPAGNAEAFSVNVYGLYGNQGGLSTFTSSTSVSMQLETLEGQVQPYVLSVNDYSASNRVEGNVREPVIVCGVNTVALTFLAPASGSLVVNTTEACPNGANSRSVPTTVIAYRADFFLLEELKNYLIYTTGGTATLGGLPVGTYGVVATGTANRADITNIVTVGAGATTTNFVFPLSCATASGGG